MITTQLRQNIPKASGLKSKKNQEQNATKKNLKVIQTIA
jgi:hypothetical protein